MLALGVYPDLTLSEARQKYHGARTILKQGIDPGAAKKAAKLRKTKDGGGDNI